LRGQDIDASEPQLCRNRVIDMNIEIEPDRHTVAVR
jgi:hypothetical protein